MKEIFIFMGVTFLVIIIIFIYCCLIIASENNRRHYGKNKFKRLHNKRSKKK